MQNEVYKDKNWLTEQYWGFDLTTRQIQKISGLKETNGAGIAYWMKKHNIPRRLSTRTKIDGAKYYLLNDINWLTLQHWGFDLELYKIAKSISKNSKSNLVKRAMEKHNIPIHSNGNLKSELQTIEEYHYPDWLVEQHYDNKLSLEKMGKKAGVRAELISKLMYEYNLPINQQIEHTERDKKGRRWCFDCKKWLSPNKFYKSKYETDGLGARCKTCKMRESLISRETKRMIAIQIYSDGNMKCKLCGHDDVDFLTIDHINGGGKQHRIKLNANFYDWLIKNNFPDGFRILCHNCNHMVSLKKYKK